MRIYNYIKLFIFIAFSILLFVFREELIAHINYFVGSLVLVFGLENLIVLSIAQKRRSIRSIKFSFSIFEMVLGLTIITAVTEFSHVCVMWAVWSLLRQSIDIHEVLKGEVIGVVAIIYVIQSIVSIVFSIILIINPTEHHAITHIYLLIAELLVIALPPVVDELFLNLKKKRH